MNSYKPYQWMGEPHDTHVVARDIIEIQRMTKWVKSLPLIADEMGYFVECQCGQIMKRSVIDEDWILSHYDHRDL